MPSLVPQGLPAGVTVQTARKMQRVLRRPQHPFHIRTRPWQIQPFLLAPVLPNETMKNLLMQSRVVTDPIKNPLIGWWQEYYFFYVKHRDMAERDTLTDMMLDVTQDLTSLEEVAPDAKWYTPANSVNWVKMCLRRVVEEYFRNDGEAWDAFALDGVPLAVAHSKRQSFLDSAILDDNYIAAPDPDVDIDANSTITASEIERSMQAWMLARSQNMVEMDYEDYLATYGVRVQKIEEHVPELIRYVRQWSYPVNHIDPTDGSPSSAVSWAITARADKDRYFREPGFVFGVSVTRPKIYLRNLDGAAASELRTMQAWLPALLAGMPEHSLRKISAAEGPLQTIVSDAGGYWLDMRDLFSYGDQYVNFALSAADINAVDLPNAALTNKHYADGDDADALFAAASPANQIRQDGIVSLAIAGQQRDVT